MAGPGNTDNTRDDDRNAGADDEDRTLLPFAGEDGGARWPALLLRRQWLIEQVQALIASQEALPQPAGPTERLPAALIAYHEAVERYCAEWDLLQTQFALHMDELLENIRCCGGRAADGSPTSTLIPAEIAFIGAYDQWQQAVTQVYKEDAQLARRTRDRVARRQRPGGREMERDWSE